jgi:glutaminase
LAPCPFFASSAGKTGPEACAGVWTGPWISLASYIPELAGVDPDRFAISLVTADGFGYDAGDRYTRFTIQSVSKAIVYDLGLEDWGHADVLRRIGVEPPEDPFNSVTFNVSNNRPFKPMVNVGAIAARR